MRKEKNQILDGNHRKEKRNCDGENRIATGHEILDANQRNKKRKQY
jgi:hypothetical protein